MLKRKKTLALTSVSGVLLAGVVLILLNVLANEVPVRWDLTRHHVYSLADSSKRLVRSLEDPVVIKVYFSPRLPAPYNVYSRYLRDVLTEYRAASRGRVRYEFVPTEPAQEFEQRAVEAGLMPLQFEEMGNDQLQIRRGFMGLVLFYRDQTDVLTVIKNVDHLEYDLTSRIARMARKNRKLVATILGHGETNWRGSQLKVAQDLPTFYDVSHPINLPLGAQGPIEGQDAMLIVGPQMRLDDTSLWVIDQTIMKGTPAAILLDTNRFSASQFMMSPQSSGLEDLLKHYGLNITDQLILDPQCTTVGMTQNLGGYAFTTSVRYPFIPLVTRFAKDHPILSGIESVGIPFPTRILEATLPEGVKFTPLLFSSDQSRLAPPHTVNVAPNMIPPDNGSTPHGPFVVGGVLEGTFPSYFAGKPAPLKDGTVIPKSPRTSIFVLTTSHVLDPNLPEFPGNSALITNALAYLSHDDTLIGIQSKGDIVRPLKPVSTATREIVKYGCVGLVPLLSILWGLVRWRRREGWRRTIAAGFAPLPDSSAASHP